MYRPVPDFSTPGKPYFKPEKTKHVTMRKTVILIIAVAVVVAAILVAKFFFIPERYGVGVSIITLPKSWKVTTETNECLQAVKGDAVLTMTASPMAESLTNVIAEETGEGVWSIYREDCQAQLPLEGMAAEVKSRELMTMEDNDALCVKYVDKDGIVHTSWWWIASKGLYQLDLVGEDEEILEYIPRIRTAKRSAQAVVDYT